MEGTTCGTPFTDRPDPRSPVLAGAAREAVMPDKPMPVGLIHHEDEQKARS